ncbi:Undecaprenyl diphosphate synthase [Hortaea werneckii]|nr:Undecaprenyl diphosphate synthase [Hortaea werneckii]
MVGTEQSTALRYNEDTSGRVLNATGREHLLKPYLPSAPKQEDTAASLAGRFRHTSRVRPAIRQLLHWTLFAIIHTFFSVYIRLRQVYHAVLDRLFALLYYHHRTPELIQRDVKGLSKVPNHLSVVLELPPEGGKKDRLETLMNDACEVAAWSACSGIPMLSIYEQTGILKSTIPHLHRRIERTLTAYYGSTNPQKPTFFLRAPHLPSYSPPESPEPTSNGANGTTHSKRPHLNILLISTTDGRQTLVDLTRTLASMAQDSKIQPSDISDELIDAEITESVMGEPDLLLLFGDRVTLKGYPPWQVRLTEIYGVQDHILTSNISAMEAIVAKSREDMGALTRRLQASPVIRTHDSVDDISDMIRRGEGVTQIRGQSRKVNPRDEESSSEDVEETIPRTRPEQSITTINDTPSQDGFDARLQYLHTIWEEMKERAETVPVERPVDLKNHIQPYQHQLQGTAVCLHAEKTDFRGLILADSTGMGKTLQLLRLISIGRQAGDGPSVVVAPSSCCRQWVEEVKDNFKDGTTPTLLLTDKNVGTAELCRYKLIVVSCSYLVSEYRRLIKFDQEMDEYEKGNRVALLKRMKVILLSGVWEMDGVQALGRYLCLDEAHTFKNINSQVYRAVQELRTRFMACYPTTSTPLDNTWVDCFAPLSLLLGHPFTSMHDMLEMSYEGSNASQNGGSGFFPKGFRLQQLAHLLRATMYARPAVVSNGNLPPEHGVIRNFQLPKWDLEKSNTEFDKYSKSIGMANEDQSYGGGDEERQVDWASLIRAQQYAYHPELVRMIELQRKMANQHLTAEGILDTIQMTTNEEKHYLDWKKSINENEKSRSARVDVIIDIVNYSRELRPGDAILIFDESTFFLDILEAASTHVIFDPVKMFRYSMRSMVEEELGKQADHRVYRPGQTKPVTIYELRADHCKVETYKVKRRDKKTKTNVTIMDMVKMEDGVVPPKWDSPCAE